VSSAIAIRDADTKHKPIQTANNFPIVGFLFLFFRPFNADRSPREKFPWRIENFPLN